MKKWMVLVLIAVMSLTMVSNSFAGVSEAAVLFLLISPGARAAGMGEAFVAVADDASAVFWNPAGLAFQSGREVTFTHAKWLPQLVTDMAYEFVAYKQYLESINGTIGANVTFLNLGEQQHTSATGEFLGTFNSWDLAVSMSYGTKLTQNLGLGVTARYIRSNLAPDHVKVEGEKGNGTGTSFGVDLGVLYKIPKWRNLRFGANLSNMGPKITYVDAAQADPIPTNLKLGLAIDAVNSEFNKLTISMDTNKDLVVRKTDSEGVTTSDEFYEAIFSAWSEGSFTEQLDQMISSIGAEYIYNNMISIRGGYYYDYEGKVQYPAFGAGLSYSGFQFDFAYVAAEEGHPLSDTMRFSLSARF